MKWAVSIVLLALMVAHVAYADKLEEPKQRIDALKTAQDRAASAGPATDSYELRQVKRAEINAEECRRTRAHHRTTHANNPRIVALLERRRCLLFDEVAKERRRAYERRRRIARQQEKY